MSPCFGLCYCFLSSCSIRDITAEVGAAVLQAAVAEDLAEGHGDVGPRELKQMSKVRVLSTCYLNDTVFSIAAID